MAHFPEAVRADALSASTSTMFVGGPDGSLYTRMFDFDTGGADIVQLKYSWESQKGVTNPRIQLPPLGWATQLLAPLHDIDEAADLCWLPAAWGDFSARGTRSPGIDEDKEASER